MHRLAVVPQSFLTLSRDSVSLHIERKQIMKRLIAGLVLGGTVLGAPVLATRPLLRRKARFTYGQS